MYMYQYTQSILDSDLTFVNVIKNAHFADMIGIQRPERLKNISRRLILSFKSYINAI